MLKSVLQPITSKRKVEAAQQALKEMALELGAHNKLPTAREICRGLQISAVTLDHVLNGLEAQSVIVRRPGSGIYVSPRLYQKSVGLVFGRHAFQPGVAAFCSLVVECCSERAQNHNERFSFYLDIPRHESENESPVHADLLDALNQHRLDGILLVARHSVAQEMWLRTQPIPVVGFAAGVTAPYQPGNIGFDVQEMALRGTKALTERGCRRLGVIAASDIGFSACAAVLEAEKITLRPEWLSNPLKDLPPSVSRSKIGYEAMQRLLEARQDLADAHTTRPDGVLIMDDLLAAGAAAAAEDKGLKLGRDIFIATHANKGSAVLQQYEDRLILMEIDPAEIVEEMFGMLERMMKGTPTTTGPVNVSQLLRVGGNVGSM